MTVEAVPRSLADALRGWDDPELVELLRARPDLSRPCPPTSRLSRRAPARCPRCHASSTGSTVSPSMSSRRWPSSPSRCRPRPSSCPPRCAAAAVEDTVARFGRWPSSSGLPTTCGSSARSSMPWARHARGAGPAHGGLERAARSARGQRPGRLDAAARRGPRRAPARPSTTSSGGRRTAGSRTPDDRLSDPAAARTPCRVAPGQRAARGRRAGHCRPPARGGVFTCGAAWSTARLGPSHATVTTTALEPVQADRSAAAQAFTAVRLSETLLESWGLEPPPVLRAGGLGVRELRRAATTLDVDERMAALVIETAHACRAARRGRRARRVLRADTVLRPVADPGHRRPLGHPHRGVARLHPGGGSCREPRRARQGGGRARTRSRAPGGAGGAPRGPRRAARAPARRRGRRGLARRAHSTGRDLAAGAAAAPSSSSWTIEDAELLGVTGRGALVVAGPRAGRRRRRRGRPPARAAAAHAARPRAPAGRPHRCRARPAGVRAGRRAVAARGHRVHRRRNGFPVHARTPSGERSTPAGQQVTCMRCWPLGRARRSLSRSAISSTTSPRRHGQIRVGGAVGLRPMRRRARARASWSQTGGASALRLRRLAPTVVAAQAPVDQVLHGLRAMGYAPAAEASDGTVVVRRPDTRRTPPAPAPPAADHRAGGPRRHAARRRRAGHPRRRARGPCALGAVRSAPRSAGSSRGARPWRR